MVHHLDAGQVQYEWNNAIPPRLEIEPGDTVVLETRDAADRYYSRASTHADVLGRGPFRGHPLTGPVRIRGARPGDVLVVDILEVKPADFGWTAIRPGRGLLPESDF
ncbi:MAG TPA: acetamidase/formamidase family protein, partial [Methylomirabilota bacterium]|nr:acetamidase/formamidase family protein [Methylomirabilota bacterium]